MTVKSNVGKPELASVLGRTAALSEVVDLVFDPGTAKNVTGGHVGQRGGDKLVAFLKENAPIVSQALHAPQAAAPTRSTPAATAPATHGLKRAEHESIIKSVEPLANTSQWSAWSDDEMRLECERCCFQAHVRFPGMRSDEELSKEFWRKDASTITGNARYLRSRAAEKVKAIINAKGK